MKKILTPLGLVALATALLVRCGAPAETDTASAETANVRLTRVGVQTMQAAPFSHSFAVQGNVQTDRIANVLASFPGVVREVLVEEGAKVNEGTALVRIDTDVLAKQRAELVTQLELAQTLFERQERLWEKEIGSEVDYLQAKTGMEALKQSLATLDEQIDQAVIRAPFEGVLDRVFVNVGEMASAPMPVGRALQFGLPRAMMRLSLRKRQGGRTGGGNRPLSAATSS